MIKWEIINDDCVKFLQEQKKIEQKYDLIFADPPFNVNYKYDIYKDNLPSPEYLNWCETWIRDCYDVLKPTGTFWLASGDEYAAELCCLAKSVGFIMRNWVIWHYTFGSNTRTKFVRSHTHLLYFVKSKKFTWNGHLTENRIPSQRQIKYNDKRACASGKVYDDVWEFSRVCGTFKERLDHPCQMPLDLLKRIVSYCSNPNDLVFDPFAGSGTTLRAAVDLGRNAVGVEVSSKYVGVIQNRMSI